MSSNSTFLTIICFAAFLALGPHLALGQYFGATNPSEGFWNVGFRLGSGWVEGDVSPQLPNFDIGIYGQKQLSRQVDVRFSFNAGVYSGQDFAPSRGFLANPVLNGFFDSTAFYTENTVYFQNFRMQWLEGNFQLKLNLNRLFSEYDHESWDAFVLMGVGAFFSQTKTDAFSDNPKAIYDYNGIVHDVGEKVEVLEALTQIQDGSYESFAERDLINSTFFRNYVVNSQLLAGFGVRLQLTNKIYGGFQAEYVLMGNDLLDGQQWLDTGSGIEASLRNDRLIRLGLTLDYQL